MCLVSSCWSLFLAPICSTLMFRYPCCDCRGAEGKPGSVGYSKVDIVEGDDDESGDRVLEDQFNRFAMAMALQDSQMAQQIMQEMG